MSINIDKNNILLNNKIIFTRISPNLDIPNSNNNNNNNKVLISSNKSNEYKDKFNRLPPPLWCLNEKNGCICGKQFRNPFKYKLHMEVCPFDDNNTKIEEQEKTPEEQFCDLDDDTIDIIESYERMTGNNILIQFLIGQIDFNLIDKIKKEYYDDEFFYFTDIDDEDEYDEQD